MTILASSTTIRRQRRRRAPRGPLVLALGCLAAYAAFFLLPYVVNGLYLAPLDEVAGGSYDPKSLWPHTTDGMAHRLFDLGVVATMFLGPLMAGVSVLWAGAEWVRRSGSMTRDEHVVLGVTLACGGLILLGLVSPFGQALMAWVID